MPKLLELPAPYALFLGDGEQWSVKTATGNAHWRPARWLADLGALLQRPCRDPVRTGVGPLVDRLLQEFPRSG